MAPSRFRIDIENEVRHGFVNRTEAGIMGLKELLDAAKQKTGGFGGDKLAELADSINEALPFITAAGYVVEQVQTTLGVPPKVVLRARVIREITDEEYDALIERAGEKVVSSIVAGTFLKAAALQRNFRIGSLHSSTIDLELSPLPAVRFVFEPPKEQARNGSPTNGALQAIGTGA